MTVDKTESLSPSARYRFQLDSHLFLMLKHVVQCCDLRSALQVTIHGLSPLLSLRISLTLATSIKSGCVLPYFLYE